MCYCICNLISYFRQVQLLNGETFPVNFKNPKDYENLQNFPLWNPNGKLSAYLADITTIPGQVFMEHTHVWQILINEWIILHVMTHTMKECLEVLFRVWQFHWESSYQFSSASHVNVVIVQIVENCTYSFAHVPICQNTCNLPKSTRNQIWCEQETNCL